MAIVTFLSDLGYTDVSVSNAKTALARYILINDVVDITHGVLPYQVRQAAHTLSTAYVHFPNGTVHIAMTDIFYTDRPRILLAEKDGHYFIAPDNGLLAYAFDGAITKGWLCRELTEKGNLTTWMDHAGKIIKSIKDNEDASTLYFGYVIAPPRAIQPKITDTSIDCYVRYIDQYGNVVLNARRELIEGIMSSRSFSISLPPEQKIEKISTHYTDVERLQYLCRFNSSGFLEIAINHGSAAKALLLSAEQDCSYVHFSINLL